jgi:DNA-binding transcriptional LysR family regulator
MTPTPRAEALSGPLRAALSTLEGALGDGPVWDPAVAERSFAIGTSDYAELVLLPPLVARLAKQAPSIDVFVRALDEDIGAQLASGKIDVAIAPAPQLDGSPSVHATALLEERFVCVMRKGHPLAKKRLTLDRFCAASHALVAPRGKPGGYVDEALAKLGRSRRVALAVPHFLVAPHVLVETDLVVTLAERVAKTFAGMLPLVMAEPPVELSGFTMVLAWHERTASDPAHAWLRRALTEVAMSVKKRP